MALLVQGIDLRPSSPMWGSMHLTCHQPQLRGMPVRSLHPTCRPTTEPRTSTSPRRTTTGHSHPHQLEQDPETIHNHIHHFLGALIAPVVCGILHSNFIYTPRIAPGSSPCTLHVYALCAVCCVLRAAHNARGKRPVGSCCVCVRAASLAHVRTTPSSLVCCRSCRGFCGLSSGFSNCNFPPFLTW